MAAVNEEITGNEESGEFTPTESVSEFMIEQTKGGTVDLLEKVPSGDWKAIFSGCGSRSILTPDTSIKYMFRAKGLSTSTRVYMGP